MLQRSLAQSEEDEEKLDALGGQLKTQVRQFSRLWCLTAVYPQT